MTSFPVEHVILAREMVGSTRTHLRPPKCMFSRRATKQPPFLLFAYFSGYESFQIIRHVALLNPSLYLAFVLFIKICNA